FMPISFSHLKLEPQCEFRLSRRRINVGEQGRRGSEQRTSVRGIARNDVCAWRGKVRAIENVEQLRDEFGPLLTNVQRLRKTQIDVRERRTVDLRDRRQVPSGPERVDRVKCQGAASRSRQDTRRKLAGQCRAVKVTRRARRREWQT